MIARAQGRDPSRETLNRERVVRAAMDLADESGIESVTMRELGRRLGVEAASLYNHVAGKDDLLSGMTDLAAVEIELPSSDIDWKDAMRRRAISARGVFLRHRWAAALLDSRDVAWSLQPDLRGSSPWHAHRSRVLSGDRLVGVHRARQLHLRLRAPALQLLAWPTMWTRSRWLRRSSRLSRRARIRLWPRLRWSTPTSPTMKTRPSNSASI